MLTTLFLFVMCLHLVTITLTILDFVYYQKKLKELEKRFNNAFGEDKK